MAARNWRDVRLCIGLCNNQEYILSEFFWSFQGMLKPKNEMVIRGQSRLKAASLNRLVESAFKYQAQKILFLDVDQTFPRDTIPRLLTSNLPVVSGLTHLREPPYSPAAGWFKNDEKKGKVCVNQNGNTWKKEFVPFPDNEDHLVEVDWTGVSCLMVDMSVFNKIYFPCFKEEWVDEKDGHSIGDRLRGHDVLFCEAVRDAGIRIYVDTLVQCGHIGQVNINDLYVKSYYQSGMDKMEQKILKDYSQEVNYWDEQYFSEKVANVVREYGPEWNVIVKELNGVEKIAEVGCGMGQLMEFIYEKKGVKPYGYDFSKVAINTITQKGFDGEVADLRNYTPDGVKYDCVIGSHVLEHMKDDISFLKTCAKMLQNENGKVIMSVPFEDYHPISLMEHQHNYTYSTLKSAFDKVFRSVKIKKVSKEKLGVDCKPGFVAIGSKPNVRI